jgi:MinD-like ATPase involved in chromosome partitioning or flagellar assembly/tetratricopeptide (TPR) repeat protein
MPDLPVDSPPESSDGLVATFYSYKGGTGRTMALANVAWILAANGHRVLVADWDLESPGLHRFFHPFLDESDVREASGIINLIRDYEWAATKATDQDRAAKLIPEHARIQRHALSLRWDFENGGGLDFLSSGRQNRDYAAALASLDWDNFYHGLNGGEFIDAVRADMKRHYDYVLIDSRTGLSDVADICTLQLPDVLVDCFTLSTQGIEGAAQVARVIEVRHKERGIRILPVPMRVDPAEQEKVEAGRAVAARLFDGLPAAMSAPERRDYWAAVEVPYRAFYAYEETLAVFVDLPGSPASLLSSFERIAARITNGAVTGLPPMDEHLRSRTKQLFTRRPPRERDQVIVEFAPQDQLWGEWIAGVLQAAGIMVHERRLDEPAAENGDVLTSARTLTVVSAAYVARHRVQPRHQAPDVAVYIAAARPLTEFSLVSSAFLAGLPENEAVERLRRLLGISGGPAPEGTRAPRNRYPGSEPKIDRAPNRNPRFTGRESDLRKLREQLRDYGTAVVPPVTLQGLGGVGKTQVAQEYVHRFKSDYDLVWWLDCGQPQFIDASLADLGALMQEVFTITPAPTANVEEAARQVLQLLSQGNTAGRWLLVFDNAEEIEQVRPFVPAGGGDVLITSRNPAWADQARPLSVDVFTRPESVLHLRQRVPSITEEEADRVAEVLGDLPLAVATAGAWLYETSFTVSDYLLELEHQAPRTLSIRQLADYPQPVSKTWDVSLNRLRERSAAAARLFEMCSVMAPRIALDLIYSTAMARVLEPLDSQLSERMIIGTVVQEINKLALIKLDHTAGRMHVHLLVQAVVQDRMSPEDIASAQRDVHKILAAGRPDGDVEDPDIWPGFRVIWPHLGPSQAMTSIDESVRQLFVDRVRYLWQRHSLERGNEFAAEVQNAWEAMLAAGPEPTVAEPLRRQLLQLRFNLANILRDQARLQEARALDEAVLAEQKKLLGADHPHTLMTAGSLAADLKALGRYREALKMDEETYPAWTERYGEDYARTLAAANNLAVACLLTGDISRALRVDEDTLQRRYAALGPVHPRTLDSESRVARDLLEAGRYAEAAARMEAVRESYIEVQRTDSLAALNAQVLLGIALRSNGAPDEAEPHFRAAWDGLSRGFGRSSSEALACRLSHALNRQAIEPTADAEAEIRQVLTLYQQRLGPSHPHTLVCLLNLAGAQRMRENYEAALQTVSSAAEGLQEVLGRNHPYTLAAMVVRGVLLADHGDLDQAEAVEAQAADDLERVLGAEHPDTLRCRANLLLTRIQRQIPGAAAERNQTIDQLAALVGAHHPDIATLRGERRLMRALDPQPF